MRNLVSITAKYLLKVNMVKSLVKIGANVYRCIVVEITADQTVQSCNFVSKNTLNLFTALDIS